MLPQQTAHYLAMVPGFNIGYNVLQLFVGCGRTRFEICGRATAAESIPALPPRDVSGQATAKASCMPVVHHSSSLGTTLAAGQLR
jgi:hypothetical protein